MSTYDEPTEPEAARLYRAMTDAHAATFGAPDRRHCAYLWGLARELVTREGLQLHWGTMEPTGVLPVREGRSRGQQVAAVERLGRDAFVAMRWASKWRPEEP